MLLFLIEKAYDVIVAPARLVELPFKKIGKIDRERRAIDAHNLRAPKTSDIVRNVILAITTVPPFLLLALIVLPFSLLAAAIAALLGAAVLCLMCAPCF